MKILQHAIVLLVVVCGCSSEQEKAAAPAKVEHAVTEAQLTTVTLTPDAVQRLGIMTVAVETTSVAPTRTVGGEVIVPPGHSIIVSAPVAGTVLAPSNNALPAPGARVSARQPLLRLMALPPSSDLARIQQDFAVAEARLAEAQAEADRVQKLYADRLVSTRDYERTRAELVAARAAYEAASSNQNLVRNAASGDWRGVSPLLIAAPEAGILRAMHVAPGQIVAAGTPLAELMRVDRLWVRVPVYVGDAGRFIRNATATVHSLGGPQQGPVIAAVPVRAPPSADPNAASIDLFYELRGTASLHPGERVGVTIPLQGAQARALAVPLAAIVRDYNGGAWVYERVDSITFVRQRVDVERVIGQHAVLASGPKSGTKVVTAGAAELFGTEFGIGK